MNTHTYRWPKVFIGIAISAAIAAVVIPSSVGSWTFGLTAAVFFALTLLSLPTAVEQDSRDRSDKEEMRTTLGGNV